MDAFRALDAVGLADRETVRAALRATMVKRAVDVPTFDALFDLYFSGLGEAIREVTAATQAALGARRGRLPAASSSSSSELLREQGIELSPLAQALLRADAGRLEQMLREAARAGARSTSIEHGFQEGQFTHAHGGRARPRRARRASWSELRRDLAGAAPDVASEARRVPRPPPARPRRT